VTTAAPPVSDEAGPIILFDGACELCSRSVAFVVRRDPEGRFRFAAIQSPAGRALLERHGLATEGEDASVILLERGRVLMRSDAALTIARGLRSPWHLLHLLHWVPRPLRDLGYAFVARIRYRIWGRDETCVLPTSELHSRILS